MTKPLAVGFLVTAENRRVWGIRGQFFVALLCYSFFSPYSAPPSTQWWEQSKVHLMHILCENLFYLRSCRLTEVSHATFLTEPHRALLRVQDYYSSYKNFTIVTTLLLPCYLLLPRYTPAQQGVAFNSGAKQRIIRMVEMQRDPMEPPRFRTNTKIPRGPPSPPAPVLHSPTRKVGID